MENKFIERYLQCLSTGVREVWQDGSFSDVEVKVTGRTYSCHRIILASLSQYFQAMFRSGMKESLAGCVEIHSMEAGIFEAVLRFMYTGDNVVQRDNVESLLQAAVMLQIPSLEDICESFLKKQIGPENCLGIWRLASSLNCFSLAKKCWTYILEFFSAVLISDEFHQISADNLIEIINDDDLNTPSEEAVCDAVLKWVDFDPNNRRQELGKLFRNVRFPLICVKYVKELRKKDIVLGSEECNDMLKDVFLYLTSESDDPESELPNYLSEMSRKCHHRQEEMMCIVGTRSRHPNPQATEIKCFSFRRDAEYSLAALPEEPGACFGITKCRDDVYVSGGYHGGDLVLKYKSSDNRWQHCTPMLEGRWGHSMVEVNGCIYAIGGSTRVPQTLSSIECYDPKLNQWKIVGGLVIPVSFMPTAAIGNRIYIFGGKMMDRTLSTKLQCFDTVTKHCFILDEMPLVSSTASRVAVIENTVYIFYRHGDIMEFKEGGRTTVVGNMPHFDHYGVVPQEGQILIVGCQSNQYSTVMFNPSTREMAPYCRTVKAALCNFYCLPITMSRQHMSSNTDQQSHT
ncbi:KLHL6-like protein [Mya arenaria]|uniref:KLHL6-like protein n=1 Tax=Mya arenaria TaxID=6604 RepID=A0ABY7DMA6_MYAAR|nr:kelch-like protein 25 [Mya arenaria]XP_052761399.1 kelch-like protein 25 [Mya arenaria]WAQ97198.1 KLHL6-like protein [Mya arenaria]